MRYPVRPGRKLRLSVSLPAELVAWVRIEAAKHDIPISAVVVYALETHRDHLRSEWASTDPEEAP